MTDAKKTKAQLLDELAALRARLDAIDGAGNVRYRLLLDTVPDMVYEVALDGTIVYANQALLAVGGWTPDRFGDVTIADVIHPDDLDRTRDTIERMVAQRIPQGIRAYRLRSSTGETIPVEIHSILMTHDGRPPTIVGIARDMRERLRAKAELAASEERYRELFETINEGILSADARGRIIAANPAAARILGYKSPDDVLGTSGTDLYFDVDCGQALVGEMVDRTGVRNREIVARRRDGSLVNLLGNFYSRKDAGGRPIRYDCVLLDITDRKQAENRVRESERKIRSMLEASPDIALLIDRETRIVAMNEKAEAAFSGYTDSPIGKLAFELFPPESAAVRRPYMDRAIAEKKPVYFQDERNGQHWETYVEPFVGEGGEVRELAVFARDITERKRGEQRLRRAKEDLDHAQRIAQLGSWTIDPISLEATWSDQMYTIHGRDPADGPAPLPEWLERVHPKDVERLTEAIGKSIETREAYEIEFRIRRWDDDEERIHHSLGEVVHFGNGHGIRVVGTTMDVTERARAEAEKEELYEQLNQAQRLESIGKLAGGVAHDFNNILMGVVGGATIIKRHTQRGTDLYEKACAIERSAEQAVLLTNQLLAFARGGKYQPLVQDLNDIVAQAIDFLPQAMKKRVVLHTELTPGLPPIEADRTQVIQVVTNLCFNAEEAMNRHGEIYIETHAATAGRLVEPLRDGHAVYNVLSVWDTGPGIPDDVRKHIFDPFYTSKGYGRGLGLSAVYGIVRNHRGVVSCDKSPTGGARFTIFFPAADVDALPAAESAVENEAAAPKRGRTVLVVDDDRTSREMAASMLESIGYRALTAGGGRDALDIFRKNVGRIDLVLLDVLMPGMDGKDVWQELTRVDPGIGVVFMSGFVNELILPAGSSSRGTAFIQKPFDIKKLVSVIQKYMDGERG